MKAQAAVRSGEPAAATRYRGPARRSTCMLGLAAVAAIFLGLSAAADEAFRTDQGGGPLPPPEEVLAGTRDAIATRVELPDPGDDFGMRGTRNGRILVWSSQNTGGNTADVAAWIYASHYFDEVVAVDQDTAFSLSDLLEYDGVLFFSNHGAGDDSVGNVLADYADTGRRLVVCTFADNQLQGRIVSDQILPLLKQGGGMYSNATIGSKDASRYWLGVNSITGFYRDDVKPSSGAVVRGTWSDGEPLLATKGSVVSVNLFPDDSFGSISGDYRALFVNALLDAYTFEPLWINSAPEVICAGERSKLSVPDMSYRAYYISLSDLVSMDSNCGSTGSQYDFCTGNNPGFRWQDEGVGAATGVYIEMKVGVECESGGSTYGTLLNGVSDTSFARTPYWCNCDNASGSPYVYLTMNSDNYNVGGTNELRVTGTCFWGLIPEARWNNAYAIVYVYYNPQKTFYINADRLANFQYDCGNGSLYNWPSEPPGFDWVDRSNAQARSVRVQLHTGVECHGDGTKHDTSLNGIADESYTSTPNFCDCSGTSGAPDVLLDLNPASYRAAGATNQFRLTNNQTYWGLFPNAAWSNAYALVTVDYDVDRTISWYDDECGGNLIGTGETLVVAPTTSTTYYARIAERADQAEIDTYSDWDGRTEVSSFGEPNTATYGQTFIAPASTLQTFTFAMNDELNTDFVEFDAYIATWDDGNGRATGPLLWSGGPYTTTNNHKRDGFERFIFKTGGVKLTPGNRYVAFLSASHRFDGENGTARWAHRSADVYAGGTFVYMNNGKNFGSLFSNKWSSLGSDLAFDMTFADEAVSDECAVGYVYVSNPPAPTKALADPNRVCNEAPVELSLAPTEIDVYEITSANLMNFAYDCGNGSVYNGYTDAGFSWTDTGSVRPRHVWVQLSVGVECNGGGYIYPTSLNGYGGPTFPQTPPWCDCDSHADDNIVTLELYAPYYFTGSANQFLVSLGTWWGLVPNSDWGGAYARVIVDRAFSNDYYQVEWREGRCDGDLVGVGDPLVIHPDHSATYYATITAPKDRLDRIETFSAWDGSNYVWQFGEPNTATYGQTFTALGPYLYYFVLAMDDLNDPEPVTFDAYVMQWDDGTGRPTGPILWQAGPFTTTNNHGSGGFEYFGFYMSDQYFVPLTTGARYVFFLSASNYFNGTQGTSKWAFVSDGNAYPDGIFVYNNNGSDFGALFDTTWSGFGDIVFEAYFSDKCTNDRCVRVHVEAGHGERGDANGDNSVDFDDIDAFVTALISCADWAAETGLPVDDCLCRNDINQDGSVDFNDIDSFVECLVNGGCP